MESLRRSVDAREPNLDRVRSGKPPLLTGAGQHRSAIIPPMATLSPSLRTHLGWAGGSRERPRMSWLRARGLGTGLGALAFLHQMAKPPMSLEGERSREGSWSKRMTPDLWGICLLS